MANIDGTPVGEVLDGTPDADIINGLGGNDTLNGLAGNDILNGGTGTDILNGGDDDDTLISDVALVGDRFFGDAGFDTLELRPFGSAPSSSHFFSSGILPFPTQIAGIEVLRYASTSTQGISAQFNSQQFASAGFTEVQAGAGRDTLTLAITTTNFTLSGVTFTGWSAAPTNAWQAATDTVTLVSLTSSNVTINAIAGLSALQSLVGGAGNDTLNGSENADRLDGGAGFNDLYGNGGNDVLSIVNRANPILGGFGQPTFFNGSGCLFDGGSGTDVLAIGGVVYFQGTLQNIEGINLLPAIIPTTPNSPLQEAAVLVLNSSHIAMLPNNAFFQGIGAVVLDLDDGADFDGSGYVIVPGSTIGFDITAGDGDGISIIGTSASDRISFGAGNQTATGGGGEDLFVFGDGTVTVLDFTQGEDVIDLNGTGLSTFERLADFLSDTPDGARISADSGGQHYEFNIKGVSAASLTPDDFLFDGEVFSVFDAGTEFDDVIFGFGLNDQLSGGAGNDRIYTGGGTDQVNGGAGDDTVIVDGAIQFGFPQPTFAGGADYDTLVVRPGAISSFPGGGEFASFAGAILSGFEAVKFESVSLQQMQVIIGAWQMAGISTVIGGAGNDRFIISANLSPSNTYTIPTLNLVNWSADDAVILAVGTGTADTTLNSVAHSGTYVLSGGSGNDTLNGSADREFLLGGSGDDRITSGGGADVVDGGLGFDIAYFAGNRADYKVGLTTSMQLSIGGATYNGIESFRFADGKYIWDGLNLVRDNRPPNAFADEASVAEDASVGGNVLGNDNTGETDPAAPDVLVVTEVNGTAFSGDTTVQGRYGTLVIAEDGSYTYTADADLLDALPAGTIVSESFDYSISDGQGGTAASALTVTVTTVADLVLVSFGNGNDLHTGSGGDEVIHGGNGNDRLFGNDGSDRIYGGLGADEMLGGAGFDLLSGGSGADWLNGGSGDDVLFGGKSDDVLTGGSGADVFEFSGSNEGADTITDFVLGTDFIHLSGGASITGARAEAGSTVLSLSTGGTILLAGVTGIGDSSALLTPSLPDWTAGVPLV